MIKLKKILNEDKIYVEETGIVLNMPVFILQVMNVYTGLNIYE